MVAGLVFPRIAEGALLTIRVSRFLHDLFRPEASRENRAQDVLVGGVHGGEGFVGHVSVHFPKVGGALPGPSCSPRSGVHAHVEDHWLDVLAWHMNDVHGCFLIHLDAEIFIQVSPQRGDIPDKESNGSFTIGRVASGVL